MSKSQEQKGLLVENRGGDKERFYPGVLRREHGPADGLTSQPPDGQRIKFGCSRRSAQFTVICYGSPEKLVQKGTLTQSRLASARTYVWSSVKLRSRHVSGWCVGQMEMGMCPILPSAQASKAGKEWERWTVTDGAREAELGVMGGLGLNTKLGP